MLKARNVYQCKHCGCQYQKEEYDSLIDTFTSVLDAKEKENKNERLSVLKKELYKKVKEEYTDSKEIYRLSTEIKNITDKDLYANFFALANAEFLDHDALNEFLKNIDASKNAGLLDVIFDFLVKSPKLVAYLEDEIHDLIDRTYPKENDENKAYYHKGFEKVGKEAKDGLFSSYVHRDVFLAYSSKDLKEVVKLNTYLEKQGLHCYCSYYNLQKGVHAKQNYDKELNRAMRNCSVFVFVSSKNSRSITCDAFKKEISYVKEHLDTEVKRKERVEYILDEYTDDEPVPVIDTMKHFFNGLEWARNEKELSVRIIGLIGKDWESPEIKKRDDTIKKLESEKDDVLLINNELCETLAETKNHREDLNQRNLELNKEKEALMKENDNLKTMLQNNNSFAIDQLKKTNNELVETLRETKNQRDALNQRNLELNKEKEALKNENNNLKTRLQNNNSFKFDELKKKNVELEKKVQKLEKQNKTILTNNKKSQSKSSEFKHKMKKKSVWILNHLLALLIVLIPFYPEIYVILAIVFHCNDGLPCLWPWVYLHNIENMFLNVLANIGAGIATFIICIIFSIFMWNRDFIDDQRDYLTGSKYLELINSDF